MVESSIIRRACGVVGVCVLVCASGHVGSDGSGCRACVGGSIVIRVAEEDRTDRVAVAERYVDHGIVLHIELAPKKKMRKKVLTCRLV
jgi:hypothetical protein